jgi:hypothetical protein
MVPKLWLFFSGNISHRNFKKHIKNQFREYKVAINAKEIGNSFINDTISTLLNSIISKPQESPQIKVIFRDKIIIGEKDESIDLVTFSILNLRPISGEVVKKVIPSGVKTCRSRIELKNDEWIIIIDKDTEYNNLKKELEIIGGYNLLYAGNIKKRNNAKFTLVQSNEIISCFKCFF